MATLGPRWIPAAGVLKILSVVGMAWIFAFFTGPLLQAMEGQEIWLSSSGVEHWLEWPFWSELVLRFETATSGAASRRLSFAPGNDLPIDYSCVCISTDPAVRRLVLDLSRAITPSVVASIAIAATLEAFDLNGLLIHQKPISH